MRWHTVLLLCSVLLLRMGPVGGTELAVTVPDGPYPIPGVLALPPADAPVPGVVLLHGTASQKNEVGDLFRQLATRLAAAGIASLRIDFAGSGDSPVSHREYDLASATRDARLALAYLKQQAGVAEDAIAVLGFSQGGLIAQRVVVAEPAVRALLTWSTVATDGVGSFAPFFDRYYATARAAGHADIAFTWLDAPLPFDLRWFEDLKTHTTLSDMRAYRGPILAVAGLEDDTVPYDQSIGLVRQSPHPHSRAVLIPGASHIFNILDGPPDDASADEVLAVTVAYLCTVFDDVTPSSCARTSPKTSTNASASSPS